MNNVKSVRIDKILGKLSGDDPYIDVEDRSVKGADPQFRIRPIHIMHSNSVPINIRGLLLCDNPPDEVNTYTIIGNEPVELPFKHIYKEGTDWSGNVIYLLGKAQV